MWIGIGDPVKFELEYYIKVCTTKLIFSEVYFYLKIREIDFRIKAIKKKKMTAVTNKRRKGEGEKIN